MFLRTNVLNTRDVGVNPTNACPDVSFVTMEAYRDPASPTVPQRLLWVVNGKVVCVIVSCPVDVVDAHSSYTLVRIATQNVVHECQNVGRATARWCHGGCGTGVRNETKHRMVVHDDAVAGVLF